jgi:hypothetical protein
MNTCQNFEFPVLLIVPYVCVAALFYMERVGADQTNLTRLGRCSGLPLRV